MAQAVSQALDENSALIVEAGTGTGKTFAYLLPALLSGKKIIISTGTKNLQDQLFHKDLPLVQKALAIPVQSTLLKGRANYLCLHRLSLTETQGRLADRSQAAQLRRIRDWSGRTIAGDIAEVSDVPEDAALWPRVTSTVDNCLGQECPHFQDCFVMKIRRKALEADIVVINHHLFCADMVLQEEGFAEILPLADAFILDEAHQLPEIASQFFGISLSSYQLQELARDTQIEQVRDAPDFSVLGERAGALDKQVLQLRLAMGAENRRDTWQRISNNPAVTQAVDALKKALDALNEALQEAALRGKGLASCHARCTLHRERLDLLVNAAENNNVHWFETRTRSFTLSLTPLEIAEPFSNYRAQHAGAWIFTSATLAISEDFSHFARRLGLEDAQTLHLESPFDFARNALLYHPKSLPEPDAANYTVSILEAALPVLKASQGRAFLLFTSYQALDEAADWLQERLDFPQLVQGTLPKRQLLEHFRQLGNAVLLGTASFWEGVDVRGEALSCVIIAKLPFAAPNNPVLQARIKALRRKGQNPFMDYQLPLAVIALKQGAGRLIRDVSDRGVLMLCDPRILTKSYGRTFLDSLPPMARTRSLRRVVHFFSEQTTHA